jgi:integrase
MRRSELSGLRWENTDLEAGTLRVVETRLRVAGLGVTVGQPKTRRSRRTVDLDDSASDLLREIRGRQLLQAAEYGEAWEDSGYLFTQPDGRPIDPDEATHAFTEATRRAGLPHLTLHGLRHVHATQLLKNNVHVKIVSERLGHATIAITLDTYSHVLPGLQRDTIRRLGRLLPNAGAT